MSTTTTTTRVKKSPFINGNLFETQRSARFWSKIRIDEWTFSLSLFVFSLTVVLGKLYVNYGKPLSQQIGDRYSLSSVASFTEMYQTVPNMSVLPKFDTKELSVNSKRFLNTSSEYAEATIGVLMIFYGKYGWLLKAMISGLVLTAFSWFILYKDSSIPGVNPPSPFSTKHRVHGSSRIHINYLVGVLNGILCFVYMCL